MELLAKLGRDCSDAVMNARHPVASVTPKELTSIELLRGAAAGVVVIYHAYGSYWRGDVPSVWSKGLVEGLRHSGIVDLFTLPVSFGFLGVNLFFILSGFCIHLPQARSRVLDSAAFAVRRFFRLYPLYAAVVLVSFALTWFKYGLLQPPATLANLLGHAAFWYYAVEPADAAMGISPVFWTIAVEVQFYLIYLFAFPGLARFGFGRCAAIWFSAEIAYVMLWEHLEPAPVGIWRVFLPHRFALARFGEWLLGAWIAEDWLRRSKLGSGPQSVRAVPLALAGAVGTYLVGVFNRCGALSLPWTDLLASGSCALLVLGAIRLENRGRQLCWDTGSHWFRRLGGWLGSRSYSLYLLHFTVLVGCVEVAGILMRVPDKNTLRGTPAMALLVLAGLLLTAIVVELAYRLIERPSQTIGRRLARAVGEGPNRTIA